jgi:arsenite methyltransferase
MDLVAPKTVDARTLRSMVQDMYRRVAEEPNADFHFEMGRALAERLGYSPADLDRIPPEAIESFAGVGYHFDLAALEPGAKVLDLGSGSGTDTFVAAVKVGPTGEVMGLDMTESQRRKAEDLRDRAGFTNVRYRSGLIEEPPFDAGVFDCVISNGVINLSPDKRRVFREAARVLVPGGRLAISDIVTDVPLPEGIVCDANLWAACIGGAAQREEYQAAIEEAGFRIELVRLNPSYRFLSASAERASRKYGVRSVSVVAVKERR